MKQQSAESTAIDEPNPRLGEIGLNNFAPYLMNRIMGRYNAGLRNEMAELGLSTPKMRALAVLSVIDGLQIGQLAVYAVVEQSTMSRTLDSMMAENLVQRIADAEDSRVTRIFITDTGRGAFEQIWPSMAEQYERMFAGVSDDERAVFVSTLQRILRNIRQHDF